MKEFMLSLHSVCEVEKFVALVTSRPFRVEVTDGRYWVQGTSFMEIFCLNLSKPLRLRAECTQEELDCLIRDVEAISAK